MKRDGLAKLGAWGKQPEARWLVLLLGASILQTVPLWLVTHPPLTDLPQHVHLTSVVGDCLFGDAPEAYALQPGNLGYLLWYVVASLLALVVGPLAAVKTILSLAIVATPLSVAAITRSLGRGYAPGLVALGLSWSSLLFLGFAQFVTALPLAFFAIAAILRSAGPEQRRSDTIRAAVLGTLAFLVHPTAGLPVLAVALVRGRSLGLRRALAIVVPCLVTAVVWLWLSPAGVDQLAALGDGSIESEEQTIAEALTSIPIWLADILSGSDDLRRFGAWGLCVLIGVTVGQGARAFGLALIAGGLLLLYVVAPLSQGWIWPIAPRFLLMGALLFAALLPFPARGFPRVALGLAHAVIAVVAVVHVGQRFERFEIETSNFQEVVECVPEGSMSAIWLPEAGSDHVRYWPYTHFGGYVQASRGGAFAFSFASHPSSPVVWVGDPPPVASNGFRPHQTRPAVVLEPFDVVLLRGTDDRIARGPRFEVVCEGWPWSVWRMKDAD